MGREAAVVRRTRRDGRGELRRHHAAADGRRPEDSRCAARSSAARSPIVVTPKARNAVAVEVFAPDVTDLAVLDFGVDELPYLVMD